MTRATPPDDGARPSRPFTPDLLTELFQHPLDPGYADAAARRARSAPSPRARRLARSVTALTLVAVGFLMALAYRRTVAEEPARSRARATLVEQVQGRRTATTELQQRADRLRAEVAGLRARELTGTAAARLRELEAASGLAPVRGSGATVTLGDGPSAVDPVTGERRVEALVKDTDLQLAANALWAGGAEAIAVNGQRLTATSTIRQAGEAILVDFRPVTSPYEVVAVGPDTLAAQFRDGYAGRFFRQLVTRYQMSFTATETGEVTLSAATELTLRVARPAVSASAGPSRSGPSSSRSSAAGPSSGTPPDTPNDPGPTGSPSSEPPGTEPGGVPSRTSSEGGR